MKRVVIILCFFFVLSCTTQSDKAQVDNIETPTKSETLWTNITELFVEFPALVVNKPSRFAAHFTILNKHLPVKEGEVTVSLVKKETVITSNTVKQPSSPGIFAPTITPKKTGNYKLVFKINTPTFSDTLVIQDVIVYASEANAVDALGTGDEASGISFLKEQAWKMDFQTAPVVRKEVSEAIPTFGVWEAAPSNHQTLIASASGKVKYVKKNMTVGTFVKKGETIMAISSNGFISGNLAVEVQKAKVIFNQAEANFKRKKELYQAKIISKSAFENVEREFLIAKENYQNLSSGFTGSGKNVKAPFSGYIQAINVVNGSFATEGVSLFTITDSQSSLLKIQVSSKYANKLNKIRNIWYQKDGEKWANLKSTDGKILSVDKTVSSTKPMLYVYAKVNDIITMPIGSITQTTLSVGKSEQGLVIPTSALLEDYGNYTVIVQLSGESFEKRQVTVGKQNGNEIQILSGLKEREYVVAKGAYQVKTASMSGQAPAHGHAH